jgi:ribosomal protein S18 acetylase RimI-like enzyme
MTGVRLQPVDLHEIRPLERHQARDAAAVLGRAFAESPAYLAALSHLAGPRRDAALERVKRGFVEAAVRYHEAESIWVGQQLAGVSLILAPGQYPPTLRAEAWQASGCATTGARGIASFIRFRTHNAKHHITEPHYYLFVLGVDPAFQGRGLGRALLAKLHERVDARQVPAYLETDTTRNVRLYESVGYSVLTDGGVAGLPGLRFWTMRRPVTPIPSTHAGSEG